MSHNDKIFSGSVGRLRSERRVKLIDPERVADAVLADGGLVSALDIGTGSALFAEIFAKRGLFSAGIDLNPAMVRESRRIVPSGHFLLASAERLPFRGKSFSLAFLGCLLHESPEPVRVLAEARRVARGMTAVLEWPYREGEAGPPMDHRLKADQIRDFAKQAGFAQVSPAPHPNMTLMLLA